MSSEGSDEFIDGDDDSEEEESASAGGDDSDSDDDNDFESPKDKKKKPAAASASKGKGKAAATPKPKAAAKATPKKAAPQKKASAKATSAPPKTPATKKAAVAKSSNSVDADADAKPSSASKKRPAAAAAAGGSATKKAATPSAAAAATAASTGDSAAVAKKTPEAAVRDYMRHTNRPYSVINVFDNLNKKVPRCEYPTATLLLHTVHYASHIITSSSALYSLLRLVYTCAHCLLASQPSTTAVVQKILDQFVASGELQSKEYGKAVIYFCNQTKLEEDVGTVTKQNVSNDDVLL
jgi:TBPIP/Hop2 winged helix domain